MANAVARRFWRLSFTKAICLLFKNTRINMISFVTFYVTSESYNKDPKRKKSKQFLSATYVRSLLIIFAQKWNHLSVTSNTWKSFFLTLNKSDRSEIESYSTLMGRCFKSWFAALQPCMLAADHANSLIIS